METEILRHIPADIHNHSTLSPDGCDEPRSEPAGWE